MSSGSPNESTASRLQRIARQADALPEDRQVPAEDYEDNVEEGEDPTHDQDDLDPVDQLDHFVELDEPEEVSELLGDGGNPLKLMVKSGSHCGIGSNTDPESFIKVS